MYILRSSVRDSSAALFKAIFSTTGICELSPVAMFKPQPAQKEIKKRKYQLCQIVTECRMRYAVQMLLMDNKISLRWRNYVAIAARRTLSLF